MCVILTGRTRSFLKLEKYAKLLTYQNIGSYIWTHCFSTQYELTRTNCQDFGYLLYHTVVLGKDDRRTEGDTIRERRRIPTQATYLIENAQLIIIRFVQIICMYIFIKRVESIDKDRFKASKAFQDRILGFAIFTVVTVIWFGVLAHRTKTERQDMVTKLKEISMEEYRQWYIRTVLVDGLEVKSQLSPNFRGIPIEDFRRARNQDELTKEIKSMLEMPIEKGDSMRTC